MASLLDSRARNLYVISSVIIVYILAGADLDQLTLLGIRSPARFPIVFSVASVVALLWFWWRYRLSWKGGALGKAFRDNYLNDLHARDAFVNLVKKNVDHDRIITSYRSRGAHVAGDAKFVGYGRGTLPPGDTSRREIRVAVLKYNADQSNHSIGTKDFPGKIEITIRVPWQLHYRHSPRFYITKALNEEAFAAQRLPLFAFGVAVLLIACKVFGGDPAGVWGLIPWEW